jgi:hypothetical protein
MLFKTLTGILAVLVLAEGGYIFLARHPINRFKPVDEDGYLAFDSATGQLCRTFRSGPIPKRTESVPSSDRSLDSRVRDPILDAIRGGAAKDGAKENTQVEFIRALPACVDIH